MEILPLPYKPSYDLIEIPCLTTKGYDGGHFEKYSDRELWGERTTQEWDQVFNKPSKEFLAFLQRWVIFGSLELFLSRKIELSSVTRRRADCSDLIFTTTGLLPILEEFYHSITRTSDIRSEAAGLIPLKINERLSGGGTGVRQSGKLRLNDFLKHNEFVDPRDPMETLFTTLLLEVVLGVATKGMAKSDTTVEEYLKIAPLANNMFLDAKDSLLYRRMRDDGWCPSELSMVFTRLSAVGIYYVSHFTRPDLIKEHPTIESLPTASVTEDCTESGKLCTKYKCAVYQLDEKEYETKHTEDCKDCFEMHADPDKIYEILKNGRIPLIQLIDGDYKSGSIPLVKSQPDSAYVAISHVWADGLGNLYCNALPRCQMLWLSQLVRNLSNDVSKIDFFWIDTIGCPPDSLTKSKATDDSSKRKAAEQKEAQAWAITRMRNTYEDACAVLVLDSRLQQLKIEPMSDTEILTRIVCSAWNGRLWTLQEGALAKLLYFQFADAQYGLDSGVDRLTNSNDLIVQATLAPMICQRVYEFRGFRHLTDRASKVMALAWALKFRSTSMLEDEPICLAALLDLDMTQITQIPYEDRIARMEKFWSLVGSVPPNLVFSDLRRLKTEGFRWAPETFLRNPLYEGPERTSYHEAELTVEIGPQGLSIKNSGLIIYVKRNPISLQFPVMDWAGQKPYLIMCLDKEFGTKSQDSTKCFNPWELYGSEKMCFIDKPIDKSMDHIDPTFDPNKYQQASFGILASISDDEGDVIYAKYLCRAVKMQLWPDDPLNKGIIDMINLDIRMATHAGGFNEPKGKVMSSALAEAKGEDQSWCVA